MAITAVCELRPRPEYANAIIQRALEQFALPSAGVAGRRFARLYQHVDDPTRLLYVAEWDSREALHAYRVHAPMPGTSEQYVHPPMVRLYRRLALFERMMRQIGVAQADIVDGPAETHVERRNLMLDFQRQTPRNDASLALLMLHEATEPPPGLLIVSGWSLDTSQATPGSAPHRDLIERLRASGATIEQFVGRVLVETVSP